MESLPPDPVRLGEVYLHISDGGVTIAVDATAQGPAINVLSRHFGNNEIRQTIYTNKAGLSKLADLFRKAAEADTGEPYCHCARPLGERVDYAARCTDETQPSSETDPGTRKP